jgi:hypothetical protein
MKMYYNFPCAFLFVYNLTGNGDRKQLNSLKIKVSQNKSCTVFFPVHLALLRLFDSLRLLRILKTNYFFLSFAVLSKNIKTL